MARNHGMRSRFIPRKRTAFDEDMADAAIDLASRARDYVMVATNTVVRRLVNANFGTAADV